MNIRSSLALLAASIVLMASQGYCDADGLTARFAGGCTLANTEGGCRIRVVASGTELEGQTVQLWHSETNTGPWRRVSRRGKALDASGKALFSFKNQVGCYRATTANNGNDVPDVRSRIICEK